MTSLLSLPDGTPCETVRESGCTGRIIPAAKPISLARLLRRPAVVIAYVAWHTREHRYTVLAVYETDPGVRQPLCQTPDHGTLPITWRRDGSFHRHVRGRVLRLSLDAPSKRVDAHCPGLYDALLKRRFAQSRPWILNLCLQVHEALKTMELVAFVFACEFIPATHWPLPVEFPFTVMDSANVARICTVPVVFVEIGWADAKSLLSQEAVS